MRISNPTLRFWGLPLFLLAGSCTSDPGDGGVTPPAGVEKALGSFKVTLKPPVGGDPGYSTVEGKVYDGPIPSPFVWVKAAESGSCRVLTPTPPFCDSSCTGGTICIEGIPKNVCAVEGKTVGVGTVGVTGLKSKGVAIPISMEQPASKVYQYPGSGDLDYPPFEEGGSVVFTAAGNGTMASFTVSATGIAPLVMLTDSLTLENGKPIRLEWTPTGTPGVSTISVLIDISHHGGSKGKIECETADNGSLVIAAVLTDKLKALGVAGFPKIEITRRTIGTNPDANVDLILESGVDQPLEIPGLISCVDDDGCPDGQTCRDDLQCK